MNTRMRPSRCFSNAFWTAEQASAKFAFACYLDEFR
jgi:hypothetical protein